MITFAFPTTEHWITNKWRYILFALLGALFGFIGIACAVIDVYMVLWLLLLKIVLMTAEWLFDYMDDSGDYGDRKRSIFGSRVSRKRVCAWLTAFGIIAIILFAALGLWQTQVASGVNNAGVFHQMLTFKGTNETVFQNEIPNDMLRLTTDELAKSIAARSSAHFGSVVVGAAHITLYRDPDLNQTRLAWIVTMLSPNLWGDNSVKGFVIVDANNPETDIKIVDLPFRVGENLLYFPPFYTGDIQGNAYWGISTADAYGRATLTQDDSGEWKYVLTATGVEQWSCITLPKGVYVYDSLGQMEHFYDIHSIPDWVTQRYDEGWLEGMISAWGGHRRGNDFFDVWASGLGPFASASPDRVEISDDTRWIIDPDTNRITALVAVDYIGSAQTMAGMFKTTDTGIEYYDMKGLNLKSGLQAQNVIEHQFVTTSGGTYEAQMPLLYPLNGKYAWFVPVYWRATQGEATSGQETLQLVALGILDPTNLAKFSIVMTNEKTADGRSIVYQGADLVKEAKRRFLGGSEQPATEKTVTGALQNLKTYEYQGYTNYILTINDTNYFVNLQNFDSANAGVLVSKIEDLHIGDQVSIIVDVNNNFVRFPR
jgi:hypothetical protein